MNIGILTFHSQLNYGGVLQAWALQTALEDLSSKTEDKIWIVDSWVDKNNWNLMREFGPKCSKKHWLKFIIRTLMGLGDDLFLQRILRTRKFINSRLNLTPFHFYNWSDLTADKIQQVNRFSMFIYGSDQIWNPLWPTCRKYLGENTPDIPKISYAASIGVLDLNEAQSLKHWQDVDINDFFLKHLSKFRAISCRETSGCKIVEKLGLSATHVVDPTMLLTAENWRKMLSINKIGGTRRLVCYFLSEDTQAALPLLKKFALEQNATVDIFINDYDYHQYEILPTPKSFRTLKKYIKGLWQRFIYSGPVKIRYSAGPLEFARAHAMADWVITDSFHSLMFSTIFSRNCRVLAPKSELRQGMFSRITEFDAKVLNGKSIIAKDLSAALASFTAGENAVIDPTWLNRRREESRAWLADKIKNI